MSDLSTTAAATAADGALTDLERMIAELRAHDRFLLTAHEGPDGDALGSLLGMHQLLKKLGKDSVMFLAAKEFPLPIEYRFLPLEEVFHEAARRHGRPHGRLPRLRQHRPDAGRVPHRGRAHSNLNIDHHHDNTRFGDVNLVMPGGLLHRRDRLRHRPPAGRPGRRRDGDAALRRADHRHRQIHVREHQRPHPPGGGRADRRRGQRRRHLSAPLRARADREAEAGRAGAGEDRTPLRASAW